MTDKLSLKQVQEYEKTRVVSGKLLNSAYCCRCDKEKKNANENIGDLSKSEKIAIRIEVQKKFEEILDLLKFDRNDPNVKETPYRIAKMWVEEVMAGRYTKAPTITSFENVNDYEGMCVVKCSIKSMCSHHFVPFIGTCWVGFIAEKDKPLIGLSKINRVVDWIARRPQLQENLTKQIADYLVQTLGVENVAVAIRAEHFCVKWRGINDDQGAMESNILYGMFKEKPEVRQEFLSTVLKG